MNKIYKVIWNQSLHCWTVVSELGKSYLPVKALAVSSLAVSLGVFAQETITCATNQNVCNIDSNSNVSNEITVAQMVVGNSKEGVLNVDGTVHITGLNNTSVVTYPLIVGNGDNGVINVNNTGSLIVDKSNGTQRVDIGHNKSGTINVSGGKFTTDNIVYVGYNSQGMLNVNDSGQASLGNTYVGVNSEGKLSISGSSSVKTSRLQIGFNQDGNVTVSGQDASLNSSEIEIERGILTVNNGGKINTSTIALGEKGTASIIIGSADSAAPENHGALLATDINFVGNDSSLVLNHTDDSNEYTIDSSLKSTDSNGRVDALNGTTTLGGDNSGYNGALNISSPAQINVATQNNLGNATIANDGILNIVTQGDWAFSNKMTGNGFLAVNTGNHTFNFQNATDTSGFKGTLFLSDTSFSLSGNNTASLASALLRAGSGSTVTVGSGPQTIGGLAFNGGTVNFGNITPGKTQSDNMVHTSSLDLRDSGAVQITTSGDVITDAVSRDVNTSLSLLEQDDENAAIQLISVSKGGKVTGSAANLLLQDQTGKLITESAQHSVMQ
ncbi:ESPR-type extended signal peptide-containing protein, partial [Escherichia coli]